MESVLVQFKGQTKELALPLGAETTAAQLQRLLENEFQVASDAQRVFFNKRRVDFQATDDARSLQELLGQAATDGAASGASPRLMLMAGASKHVIEDMIKTKQEVEAEMRIRATRKVVSIGRRNDQIEAREATSTEYRFHAIEALENFPDAHRARSLLEQLANDRGILAVMAKHKWTVGSLAEMYPDGKVGVDPVCVLGLNQNKGQKILLRLRTDDLQGFRKFLNIKKVLFHELAHNVHSDHDSKFYQLMRQVERECDELDWSNSGGREVGGSGGIAIIPDSVDESGPSGHVLGGGGNTVSRLLRDAAATSTINTAANCGDIPSHVVVSPPLPEQVEQLSREVDEHHLPVSTMELDDDKVESMDVDQPTDHETIPPPTATAEEPAIAPESPVQVAPAPLFDAAFGNYQPSERELRLQHALEAIRSRYPAESVAGAASLLHKIVSNIIQYPGEDKFKVIRKTNRLFETRIACFPECLEFLQALGFDDQSESYVLVRNDPGLLWIGRSFLEVVLE